MAQIFLLGRAADGPDTFRRLAMAWFRPRLMA